MKAEKSLFAIAIAILTACGSADEKKAADNNPDQEATTSDSVTARQADVPSTQTRSLSGSIGNGTLTDTIDINRQKSTSKSVPGRATPSTKTKSLSGSSGSGTITDTTDVNR